MWPGLSTAAGTTWHDSQGTGAVRPCALVRCAWWAPTPSAVGLVLPDRSRGGAGFCGLPWQEEQELVLSPTCTTPSTWKMGATVPALGAVSGWQAEHWLLPAYFVW